MPPKRKKPVAEVKASPKSIGRPPWLPTAKLLSEARKMAGLGMYEREIAIGLGFHPNQMGIFKDRFPELAEAIQGGRADGVKKNAEALQTAARRGNVTALLYLMKRLGWKDDESADVDGSGAGSDKKSDSSRILDAVQRIRGGLKG